MSLDTCTIVIKGNGVGHYGRPKNDVSRTVREFLKDNDVYYRAVFQHLKKCEECDPEEALEMFLQNRHGEKKGGLVSDGLLRMALRYERAFAKKHPGIPVIVDEYLVRAAGDGYEAYFENCHRLTSKEVVRGLRMKYGHWQSMVISGKATGHFVNPYPHRAAKAPSGMARVTELLCSRLNVLLGKQAQYAVPVPFPPDDEVLEWCLAAEVMHS